MGVGGESHAPAALPPGKTRYPLYRRLCGPLGRCGQVRRNSRPLAFDPRTARAIASRYTDWAIPAKFNIVTISSDRFIWSNRVVTVDRRKLRCLEKFLPQNYFLDHILHMDSNGNVLMFPWWESRTTLRTKWFSYTHKQIRLICHKISRVNYFSPPFLSS